MSFANLGLSEAILRAVEKSGYTTPTPIQLKAIPAILEGRDMMAAAQTGTGKTAGFTLPLLEMLSKNRTLKPKHARSLVITPTRELAAQVEESVKKYGKFINLKAAVVYGGVNMHQQIKRLQHGVDILVATPGRLLDLHRQRAVCFDSIEILVLDEADRMLDMGFLPDIRTVLNLIPEKHQTLLFSATFSDDIRRLAKTIQNNPVEIDIAPRNTTVSSIQQRIIPVDKARKTELLKSLLQNNNLYQVLVFSRTKHGADKLVKHLKRENISAAAIHGNKSQSQRTRALTEFKQNKTRVLVATDIAARGIDVQQLSHVINFDLPNVAEDYVHRIGRTGRAGASGEAISLVCADEAEYLFDIEKLINIKLPRNEVEGFEPEHALPETIKKTGGNRRGQPGKRKPSNGQHRNKRNNQRRGEQHAQGRTDTTNRPKKSRYAKKRKATAA
ncbi:MAG: DEAD/DEAH box helicase [Gammaproteobacteria bacterium]